MRDKLCKECAFWRDGYCSMRRAIIPSDVRVLNCEMFELKAMPTLFDRITQSPEVLAPYFVFLKALIVTNINPKQQWISTLTEEVYPTRAEAVAATVEKLKEVADAEN